MDELETEGLRAQVETLRAANAKLLKDVLRYRDALAARNAFLIVLSGLAKEYRTARDAAGSLVRVNEAASKSGAGTSGTGHKTPFEVPNAVRAWNRAAILVAEYTLTELGK